MWDEHIDDVAGKMTGGQVSRNLTSRVLARIETHHRRLARTRSGLLSAAAAAVVAVLIGLIVHTRQHEGHYMDSAVAPHLEAPAARQPLTSGVRDTASTESSSNTGVSMNEHVPTKPARSNPRFLESSNVTPATGDPAVVENLWLAPLRPEENIGNDPIETERLVTESIAINALELAPIDSQSLSQ